MMSDEESSDSSHNNSLTSSNERQSIISQDIAELTLTEDGSTDSYSVSHMRKKHDLINCSMSATKSDDPPCQIAPSDERLEVDPPLSTFLRESPDLPFLANNWRDKFDIDQSEALRSILELILHTCGLKVVFPRESALNIQHLDVHELNSWKSEFSARIFIKNDAYLSNLTEFLKLALNEKVLQSQAFMGKLQHLISIMVDSEWLSMRQTSMAIGSAVINQYLLLWQDLYRKVKKPTFSCRLELKEKELALVKKMLDSFVGSIRLFLRDCYLNIRKQMFDVFCNWFNEYPKFFVDDLYLRELFWSLYDSDTGIRTLAIKICSSIIAGSKSGQNLDLFIVKVVPALFCRVNDIKAPVAVTALKSLSLIHYKLDVFQCGNPEKIYKLIFSDRPSVSSAAASFMYEILRESHKSSVLFLKEIITFLHEYELLYIQDSELGLVRAMLPHARRQLTDWPAWIDLLQFDTLAVQHIEVASRTLSAVVHCTTHVSSVNEDSVIDRYILPPGFVRVEEVELDTVTKKKEHDLCEKNKIKLTSVFGKPLIQLWHKYQNCPNILMHLISIAGQFSNIKNMDIKEYCAFLLTLDCTDPGTSHLKMATLASLCHLMSKSPRGNRKAKFVTDTLITDLNTNLLQALAPESQHSKESTFVLAKKINMLRSNYCLSKYFDLSSTTIAEKGLEALTRFTATPPTRLENICNTAYIIMNILQWQLKNILDGKYDDMQTALLKLQSRIKSLAAKMEHFICSTNTSVRRTAFNVLSQLLTLFSKENVDLKRYPMIHLSHPLNYVTEWLNFHLVTEATWDAMPEDEVRLRISRKTVRSFCTLLKLGVLDLSYVHSILPYFRFYQERQNYNTILKETFKDMVLRENFPVELLKALVFHNKLTRKECEEVAHGLCSVVLKDFEPATDRSQVASYIIRLGVLYSSQAKDFSFLLVLCPILKVISKNESRKFKDEILRFFSDSTYDDDEFVRKFLDACKK